MDILNKMLAGAGFFFAGLFLLNSALKQLTSRRLRILLAKYSESAWQGGMIGCVVGAVVQSTTAISFILAGLLSAGMIRLRQAIPVILWSNPGTCMIVVLAFLDINLFIYFIIGLAGIGFSFEKPARYPALSQALFGVGLLFFGLNMIRTGAIPLSETHWFKTLFLQGQSSFLMSFMIGGLLTMLVQSSIAIMILAITFSQSGMLTPDQTIMMIYGANFGSSILTWMLSVNVKGTAKQIILTQVLVNVAGAVFLVILFYIEEYAGIPLVKALITRSFDNIEQQMSLVCVIFNFTGAIIPTVLSKPLILFLDWFSPPTQEEEWSRIHYLHEQILSNPETALEMAEKEQSRLFLRLPFYIEEARKSSGNESASLMSYHKAFLSVSQEIDTFLSEILKNCHDHTTSEHVLTIKNRQHLIESLEQTIFDFTNRMLSWKTDESTGHSKVTFLEGLDFLLLTTCDIFEKPNSESIGFQLDLTGDRSEFMQKMRSQFFTANQAMSVDDRMAFLQITSLYERAIWLLGRIGLLFPMANPESAS